MSAHDDRLRVDLPDEPIDRLAQPIGRFLHIEAASGFVLLACTVLALALSNTAAAEGFLGFWSTPVRIGFGDASVEHSLQHWINDGLMAVFFFVIGLEVKRELALGELRDMRRAALPIAAALGGMAVPAALYLAFVNEGPGARGWGIPMATDIAFVVGCMAVLGRRVPPSLRILLLSLAVADDIGAILVIAIGYTETIHLLPLGVGAAGIAAISILARLGVRNFMTYVLLGVVVWVGFYASGVHATIAGVILGIQTPARAYLRGDRFAEVLERARAVFQSGDWSSIERRAEKVRALQHAARETISPLEYLESLLHPWVGFVIMPLFALANAGVTITASGFADPIATAVGVGLLVGKPVGIVLFSFLAVRLGLAALPAGVGWRQMTGAGFLAGIGFTMALFIAGLALVGPALDAAKVGILAGSALAATIGMVMLAMPARGASPADPSRA
ncbi:MAG: Na+/H+ antiporter NhaA [Planctomycetes bacterium]|nr:Na+/H+ antiporter NhaA [Planctomycetota bacterium]